MAEIRGPSSLVTSEKDQFEQCPSRQVWAPAARRCPSVSCNVNVPALADARGHHRLGGRHALWGQGAQVGVTAPRRVFSVQAAAARPPVQTSTLQGAPPTECRWSPPGALGPQRGSQGPAAGQCLAGHSGTLVQGPRSSLDEACGVCFPWPPAGRPHRPRGSRAPLHRPARWRRQGESCPTLGRPRNKPSLTS